MPARAQDTLFVWLGSLSLLRCLGQVVLEIGSDFWLDRVSFVCLRDLGFGGLECVQKVAATRDEVHIDVPGRVVLIGDALVALIERSHAGPLWRV